MCGVGWFADELCGVGRLVDDLCGVGRSADELCGACRSTDEARLADELRGLGGAACSCECLLGCDSGAMLMMVVLPKWTCFVFLDLEGSIRANAVAGCRRKAFMVYEYVSRCL